MTSGWLGWLRAAFLIYLQIFNVKAKYFNLSINSWDEERIFNGYLMFLFVCMFCTTHFFRNSPIHSSLHMYIFSIALTQKIMSRDFEIEHAAKVTHRPRIKRSRLKRYDTSGKGVSLNVYIVTRQGIAFTSTLLFTNDWLFS